MSAIRILLIAVHVTKNGVFVGLCAIVVSLIVTCDNSNNVRWMDDQQLFEFAITL